MSEVDIKKLLTNPYKIVLLFGKSLAEFDQIKEEIEQLAEKISELMNISSIHHLSDESPVPEKLIAKLRNDGLGLIVYYGMMLPHLVLINSDFVVEIKYNNSIVTSMELGENFLLDFKSSMNIIKDRYI